MKKIREFIEHIPSYALPYIVNGDNSGLTLEETNLIDSFLNKLYNDASRLHKRSIQIEIVPSEHEHFTWRPAFGDACEVTDCDVLFLVP